MIRPDFTSKDRLAIGGEMLPLYDVTGGFTIALTNSMVETPRRN
jgi:hypothetical protein